MNFVDVRKLLENLFTMLSEYIYNTTLFDNYIFETENFEFHFYSDIYTASFTIKHKPTGREYNYHNLGELDNLTVIALNNEFENELIDKILEDVNNTKLALQTIGYNLKKIYNTLFENLDADKHDKI